MKNFALIAEWNNILYYIQAREGNNSFFKSSHHEVFFELDHAHSSRSGRGFAAKARVPTSSCNSSAAAVRMSKGQPVEDEINEKVDGFVTYLKHKK